MASEPVTPEPEPVTPEKLREEMWEAFTAGAELGYLWADNGESYTFDHMREDFDTWLEQRDA